MPPREQPTHNSEALGNLIKTRRESLGMTLTELSSEVKKHTQIASTRENIYRMEKGMASYLSAPLVKGLTSALGISAVELLSTLGYDFSTETEYSADEITIIGQYRMVPDEFKKQCLEMLKNQILMYVRMAPGPDYEDSKI